MAEMEEIRRGLEEWREAKKEWPERREEFRTDAGIPVKDLYTPLDTEGIDYLRDIGFPGQPPYTRRV